jgi:hypothetical protein
MDVPCARHVARQQPDDRGQAGCGDDQTGKRATGGKKQAFDELEADDGQARRTERGMDGKLTRAASRAYPPPRRDGDSR